MTLLQLDRRLGR